MPKITFMGAGSTIFAKNLLGDCLLSTPLQESHIALYDIDPERLAESKMMLDQLNKNINESRATITAHCGVRNRKEALKGANYVMNAIQVGGYKPSTVIDFEIPRKYGLRQTIGDTLGVGGIFRGLRTIPVLLDFARDMEEVCPNALFLNYSNPMSILTGAMLQGTGIKTVGLCHSVEDCSWTLLRDVDMVDSVDKLQWKIAGINHQAWLLEITDDGRDLYPEIKRRAALKNAKARKKDGTKHGDMVRLEMMLKFGYYITESSEHGAEYVPYFIKSKYPELIKEFRIPLDEYLQRCTKQIKEWKELRKKLVSNKEVTHTRSTEYASRILEAMETDTPIRVGGNVMNNGFIPNLPSKAVVEVPCLVYRSGIFGSHVGDLPEQCAALNRISINVQLLAIQAALTGKKEHIYHAAMLDSHTASELSIDEIRSMCDDLIRAHGNMLPKFK